MLLCSGDGPEEPRVQLQNTSTPSHPQLEPPTPLPPSPSVTVELPTPIPPSPVMYPSLPPEATELSPPPPSASNQPHVTINITSGTPQQPQPNRRVHRQLFTTDEPTDKLDLILQNQQEILDKLERDRQERDRNHQEILRRLDRLERDRQIIPDSYSDSDVTATVHPLQPLPLPSPLPPLPLPTDAEQEIFQTLRQSLHQQGTMPPYLLSIFLLKSNVLIAIVRVREGSFN